MGILGKLLCRLGRHKRSRGRARRSGATWVSRCRRCDAGMRRTEHGRWAADWKPVAGTIGIDLAET